MDPEYPEAAESPRLILVCVSESGARPLFDGPVADLFVALPECFASAVEDDLSCWFAALEDAASSGWSLPPPVVEPVDSRRSGEPFTAWLDHLRGGELDTSCRYDVYLLPRPTYAWILWAQQETEKGTATLASGFCEAASLAITSAALPTSTESPRLLRTAMWCYSTLEAMRASAPRRGIDGEKRLRWIASFHQAANLPAKVSVEDEEKKGFETSGPAGMKLAALAVVARVPAVEGSKT
jgi:hypothetical protein